MTINFVKLKLKIMKETKFRFIIQDGDTIRKTFGKIEGSDISLYKIKPFPTNLKIIARNQFTGLFDNTGKEIYEGDVYRDEFSIDDEKGIDERIYFVCIFFKPLADFCWISIDNYNLNPNGECLPKDEGYPRTLNADEAMKVKIIGNIYENKKLLQL